MAVSAVEDAEEAVEEEPKRIESVPATERCDGMTFKIGYSSPYDMNECCSTRDEAAGGMCINGSNTFASLEQSMSKVTAKEFSAVPEYCKFGD